MNKVAITGANGFIGSWLARTLPEYGWEPVCLVRNSSDLSLLPENCIIRKVDYRDYHQLTVLLQDCSALIHGAALTRARKWSDFVTINIQFTEKLIELYQEIPSLKRFIFLSSQAAAGSASSLKRPRTEQDDCQPLSAYGRSKMLAEKLIMEKCRKDYTIIRPASVFGPGDKDFLVYFQLVKLHLALYPGITDKYLNLIYVEDLCRLISSSLHNSNAANEIFFAAGKDIISLKQFTNMVETVMDTFSNPVKIPCFFLKIIALGAELWGNISKQAVLLNRDKIREMCQNFWLIDNNKVTTLLDFKEKFTFQEALQKTADWYKQKGWL
ncbi:MAG: NAD(P)-dependent oxidoreductase [Candidatus Cloacimonetes bacterium]|nr:NAD(P)-dependent oxidoreductase [Candidatus Cloacimonadota bacterium]